MTAVTNRYDFVLIFDVENGNPNGDPDAGNLPRMDPETGQGLVTDVAVKRKLRNYVAETMGETAGYAIYMQDGAVLNRQHALAYEAEGLTPEARKRPRKEADAARITDWMCANFWDIRSFGAVMTTEINAGQVRGPVQLTFARSAEPIMPLEISITRASITNEKDAGKTRTMGRKHVVPYGLYTLHGFVNAPLARRTGFCHEDLALLWQGLRDMFELDRSSARGLMATRRLIAFRHQSPLGNAQAHKLFDRITLHRTYQGTTVPVGDPQTLAWPPARAFGDYEIRLDTTDLPQGIEIVEPV